MEMGSKRLSMGKSLKLFLNFCNLDNSLRNTPTRRVYSRIRAYTTKANSQIILD